MGLFQTKTLVNEIEEYLREKIISSGQYKPGDKVYESKIAEEMKVARTSVREAMRMLEAEGLLILKANKGSFVNNFTQDYIEEIYIIRSLLENQVYKKIIDNDLLTANDFEFMEQIIEKQKAFSQISSKDILWEMTVLDIKFHEFIWQKSNLRLIQRILKGLYFQIFFLIKESLKPDTKFLKSIKEHAYILKCLKNKNYNALKKDLEEGGIPLDIPEAFQSHNINFDF